MTLAHDRELRVAEAEAETGRKPEDLSVTEADAMKLWAKMPIAMGQTLPPGDVHAVSVSLPTWDDVVGYEENEPRVRDALQGGYPRFVAHPCVRALQDHLETHFEPFVQQKEERSLMVLPTEGAAKRVQAFLVSQDEQKDVSQVTIHPVREELECWVVIFPKVKEQSAYRFWQHAGEIVTSRHAQAVLDALKMPASMTRLHIRDTEQHTALQSRIAELYFPRADVETQREYVSVFATGMAAVCATMRALTHVAPKSKAIVLGFPYVDSRKLHEIPFWCPADAYFLPVFEIREVEAILSREPIRSIFVEFPGNPLMTLPDLETLAALAHKHNTCLVVDDTVASFNVNVLQFGVADVVVTSLTKIFSGTCTGMGGSVVVNPTCALATKIQAYLEDAFMFEDDVQALLSASSDVIPRIARTNTSAEIIARRLSEHPYVRSVFHPSLDVNRPRMEHFWRHDTDAAPECRGYGPLISFVLHGGEPAARAFYDSLACAKGPSLGTNFTLCCPYSLLVHYHEGDAAERAGIDRYLMRISIGLEDVEAIWSAMEAAIKQAEAASPRSISPKRKREEEATRTK